MHTDTVGIQQLKSRSVITTEQQLHVITLYSTILPMWH